MLNYCLQTELEETFELFREGKKIIEYGKPNYFIQELMQRGWGKVELLPSTFQSLENWEVIFQSLFELPSEEIQEKGLYRSIQGVSVGYRGDKINASQETNGTYQIKGEREFIECRLQSDGFPNPHYHIANYVNIVRSIYQTLSRIGYMILQLIAMELGLDGRVFTDMTDLSLDRLGSCDSNLQSETLSETSFKQLSSSLLRICKYRGGMNSNLLNSATKFGAHTDTSFLTIGLTSSTPGLEIFDLVEKRWIMVEQNESKLVVNVFIGEFLQLFTNHYLQAAVHRVIDFSHEAIRISCPLIIRATHQKTINYYQRSIYNHPCLRQFYEAESDNNNNDEGEDEDEAEEEEKLNRKSSPHEDLQRSPLLILGKEKPLELLPTSYQGMKLKVIHLLLEKRRNKCFERNSIKDCEATNRNESDPMIQKEENWVLSSFPIDYLP